jgi:uncharacterized integral membrane protein
MHVAVVAGVLLMLALHLARLLRLRHRFSCAAG